MQQYHAKLSVSEDGKVIITKVPFNPGEEVDVYIFPKEKSVPAENRYPLQGVMIKYVDLYSPVAEDEWESNS